MVIHLENIHRPNGVIRANQFGFHVPGQIAADEKLEGAEFQQHDDAVGVVGGIHRMFHALGTNRIGGRVGRNHVLFARADAV